MNTPTDAEGALAGAAVLPGVTDPSQLLHTAAQKLASDFAGHFAEQTIERYLFESYTALKRTAQVTHLLPVLAETFARDRLTALAQSQGLIASTVPEILFVCVQNAGRSQMAAALLDHHAQGAVHVRTAGSTPGPAIESTVLDVMAEQGLDLAREFPKPLTDDVVRAADVVITMGCGDACPIYPGKRYLDWALADPAGRPIEEVRAIREDLDQHVRTLLDDLRFMTDQSTDHPGEPMDTDTADTTHVPQVVFACRANGGRSVASRLLTEYYGEGRLVALSAGTEPGEHIHPEVARVLQDLGLDTSKEAPKLLTEKMIADSDLAITQGCGENCPYVPGAQYRDWPLDDPKGQDAATVKAIIADIDARVRELVSELVPDLHLRPSLLS